MLEGTGPGKIMDCNGSFGFKVVTDGRGTYFVGGSASNHICINTFLDETSLCALTGANGSSCFGNRHFGLLSAGIGKDTIIDPLSGGSFLEDRGHAGSCRANQTATVKFPMRRRIDLIHVLSNGAYSRVGSQ